MSDEFTKEETERRARAAAGRLLNTPPQPRTKARKRSAPVQSVPEPTSMRRAEAGHLGAPTFEALSALASIPSGVALQILRGSAHRKTPASSPQPTSPPPSKGRRPSGPQSP